MLLGAGSDKIDPSSVILSPTFSYLSRLNSTRVHRPANRSASDTNRAWRPALDRRRVSQARRRAARGRMVRQHQQPAHPPIFLGTARHSRSTTADRVGKRIFDDFGLAMIWGSSLFCVGGMHNRWVSWFGGLANRVVRGDARHRAFPSGARPLLPVDRVAIRV